MSGSRTMLSCPTCHHRGYITLLQTSGKWGCVRCFGCAACTSCGKRLSKGARHNLCRSCRYPPRPEKHCDLCGSKINAKQNKSGICRPCRCALNRVGDANKKRLVKLAESNRDPILKVKRVTARAPVPPIRKPLDKLTPFERAMERVRQGAGIREVIPMPSRAAPQFTLGGVSEALY